MANRRILNQFQYTFEKDTVTIFGRFSVGASGAVTAGSVKGGGLATVVKEATAGQYTLTFRDSYSRFLDFKAQVIDAAVSQITAIQILQDPATLQAGIKDDKKLIIQCLMVESDATPQLIAANPVSGSQVWFKAVFRNTTVGPFDV